MSTETACVVKPRDSSTMADNPLEGRSFASRRTEVDDPNSTTAGPAQFRGFRRVASRA